MALSISVRKNKNSMGSFISQIDATNASINGNNDNSLGLRRTFFTWFSLTIGAFLCYVSLHYVPALLQPSKIFGVTGSSSQAAKKSNKSVLGPYADAFLMQRTYLYANQKIKAEYTIPKGAKLDLSFKQCHRSLIVEVFKCHVVKQRKSTITGKTTGFKVFQTSTDGFYHFDDSLKQGLGGSGEYTVVWSRF